MRQRRKVKFKHSIKDGPFYTDMMNKLDKGKDLKIIIVARNSELGSGKTTLAITLCKLFDPDWTAYQGTLSSKKYEKLYDELPPKKAILWDEMELAADRRRSMSGENIKLSHIWSMFRYKELITIGTLPSATLLDKRMIELSDARITVIRRGMAYPYYYVTDDFSGVTYPRRYRNKYGAKEKITWGPRDSDPDYHIMHEKKVKATQEVLDNNGSKKEGNRSTA